jgi:8-oxo-dGTP pyrophosphatase MutT (NUDIX family)
MTSWFTDFLTDLDCDLHRPLPGRVAQYQMAPKPRPGGEFDDTPLPNARASSVLILFYPHADTLYLPLILRPTYPGVHSGQVSFPGGGQEAGDADLIATALREAHEEVGIDPATVTVIGQLTPIYIRPSNNLVQPVVGYATARPAFVPDAREVAQLIEAPVLELLDPANQRIEQWELRDRTAHVPIFGIQRQVIWGATAMMLGELLALPALRRVQEWVAT